LAFCNFSLNPIISGTSSNVDEEINNIKLEYASLYNKYYAAQLHMLNRALAVERNGRNISKNE